MQPKKLLLCVTGASGALYAVKFLEEGLKKGVQFFCTVSPHGRIVLREELGLSYEEFKGRFGEVEFFEPFDLTAPIASGSFLKKEVGGVAVVPCSSATLGAVASGAGRNLIHRACDAALKERIPLLLAVREMPLSRIHLENMLRLTDAGATVAVISPPFYGKPKTLEELVEATVGRLLDQLGVDADYRRWRG